MYLNDLSEFYEKNKNGESLEEICPTEQMEEEICDEERYRDLYADIKRIEGINQYCIKSNLVIYYISAKYVT